jgi:hypothetical protein
MVGYIYALRKGVLDWKSWLQPDLSLAMRVRIVTAENRGCFALACHDYTA